MTLEAPWREVTLPSGIEAVVGGPRGERRECDAGRGVIPIDVLYGGRIAEIHHGAQPR